MKKSLLTYLLILPIVVMGFAYNSVTPALAHTDPGGCAATGVGLSLVAYRADGTTYIGAGTVSAGETIKYVASLTYLGMPNCYYSGGSLSITTPDGVVHDVTPGGGIPLITSSTSFTSAQISYVVNSANVGGDGDLDAAANYTNGTSHLGNNVSPVQATTPLETVFGLMPTSVTTHVHNPNHIDVTSTTIALGTSVHDNAIVNVGTSTSLTASGTISFQLFANGTCSGTSTLQSGVLMASGTAESSTFVPGAGSYSYLASYSGDSNFSSSTGVCEPFTVAGSKIIVRKVTNPVSSTQSFTFNPSWSTSTFALQGGASIESGNLAPGMYSVNEATSTAWLQTSATCSSSATSSSINPSSINLHVGETVDCTFVNTMATGTIVIVKDAQPNSSQDFTFNHNFNGTSSSFMLDDDSDPTLPNSMSFSVASGTYAISEATTTGWMFHEAICNDGSNINAINVSPGETVTCTFHNLQNGSITVDKVTQSSSSQSFNFNVTGAGYNNFSLTDQGTPNTQTLPAGNYSVAEASTTGWSQVSATCSSSATSTAVNPSNIVLHAGEVINCTFVNSLQNGHIIVDKITNTSSTQSFNFIASGSGYNNFSLTDQAAPNSQTLAPGMYSITEANAEGWTQVSAICTSNITSSTINASAINLHAGETINCVITNRLTPPSGRMTGGGSVFADGMRVTHGFELYCDPNGHPNNLEINWPGTGKGKNAENNFHLTNLTSVNCSNNPNYDPGNPEASFDTYTATGTGTLNGVSGATIEFTFTDKGEPGRNDTASMVIRDSSGNIVLAVSGNLNSGNQQAH